MNNKTILAVLGYILILFGFVIIGFNYGIIFELTFSSGHGQILSINLLAGILSIFAGIYAIKKK